MTTAGWPLRGLNPYIFAQKSLESAGPVCDEGRADLRDTVGKREPELGNEELLDVWAADILRLLNLDDTEDLSKKYQHTPTCLEIPLKRTWIDRKRARWRAAISW